MISGLLLISAYCTGLLLARRVLKKLEMDEEYQGNLDVSGSCKQGFCVYLLSCLQFLLYLTSNACCHRSMERTTLLNLLKAGGLSVLSWMSAS